MSREIKFRAYVEFDQLKLMIDGVTIHAQTNMIGLHYEHLKEELENVGWTINSEYQFENIATKETIDHDNYKVYDSGEEYYFIEDAKVMQYTGVEDKNGVEVYEGDVFRIEEDGDDICDQCDGVGWIEGGSSLKTECDACNGTGSFIGSDRIIYVVITWVQEWCMFATLRVEDEYPAYLQGGVKELDEPMFWTYTLEDTNSRKHFLCGNIYQSPELLKP